MAKRLRPVGSTSRRPRAGAPAGPGCTKRPASARMRPSDLAAPQAAMRSLRVSAASASSSSPEAKPSALSGERPNTCSPSPTRMSLRSQSQPSSAMSASSGGLPSAAHSLKQAGCGAALEDQRRDRAGATRIERLSLDEFIEQAFELERRAMRAGGDQRRRQMADRTRADPALRLRRLAGIVDDERIDDRRCADQDFGRASFRQRHRLARQPFERAVRAKLDERVDALLAREPKVERDIGMARRERQIVIVALARGRVAAVRLHRDDELAEAQEAEPEGAADQAGIVGGFAPGGAQGALERRRCRGEFGFRIRRASPSARAVLRTRPRSAAGASQSAATS